MIDQFRFSLGDSVFKQRSLTHLVVWCDKIRGSLGINNPGERTENLGAETAHAAAPDSYQNNSERHMSGGPHARGDREPGRVCR